MLIGSEDHLQNHNLRTENEDVNDQKHDKNTRIIFFSQEEITMEDIEGNSSHIQIFNSHPHFENKHFDPSPIFKHTLLFVLTSEATVVTSTNFLVSLCKWLM